MIRFKGSNTISMLLNDMNCMCGLERKRIDTEIGLKIYDESSCFDINFKIFTIYIMKFYFIIYAYAY